MTALIGKRVDRLTPSMRDDNYQPDNDDFIKTLDYEELERRFDIHKYYPKFIHNYDYSTPQIRSMIRDKPIYAKANEHLKNFKNPGSRKTYITEIDVETGQIEVRERKSKDQLKQERREERKERKEARHDRREARHEERKLRHAARKDIIETKRDDRREAREKKREDSTERLDEKEESRRLLRDYRSQRLSEKTSQPYVMPAIRPPGLSHVAAARTTLEFRDPFDSRQPTLVPTQQKMEGARSRQNSVRTMESLGSDHIKTSLGGKLRHMIRPRRSVDKSTDSLVRTSSYDQTQSMMTSVRGAKNKLLRLKDDNGRRMSGQIGTYTNIFDFRSRSKGGDEPEEDSLDNVTWRE